MNKTGGSSLTIMLACISEYQQHNEMRKNKNKNLNTNIITWTKQVVVVWRWCSRVFRRRAIRCKNRCARWSMRIRQRVSKINLSSSLTRSRCVFVCLCACVCMCVRACMWDYVYMSVCDTKSPMRTLEYAKKAKSIKVSWIRSRCVCMCMYVRVYVCACVYVCTHVCVCICVYVIPKNRCAPWNMRIRQKVSKIR